MPTPLDDQIVPRLEAGDVEDALEQLDRLHRVPIDVRKDVVQRLEQAAAERPSLVAPVVPALVDLLTDEERSVRLSTAKLFVTVAEAEPSQVHPVVSELKERLADEAEFYYVRARAAETLGYVARDDPDAVAEPDVLAELVVGLSFEEPEVRLKLAKALELVALGDPDRLRHRVERVGEHLDDDGDLVRYHLTTVLVVVGTKNPERLLAVRDVLVDRLDDENPFVRGRAAEALGVLSEARVADRDEVEQTLDRCYREADEAFLVERARFALESIRGDGSEEEQGSELGTVEGVRASTEEAVDAIASSPAGVCPHCGLELPEDAPPMCPQCGGPH